MKHSQTLVALLALIAATFLAAGPMQASDTISITYDATNFDQYQIPNGFTGLSWGMGASLTYPYRFVITLPGEAFASTNAELITLFEQTGMRHVRLGWGTGDPTNLCNILTLSEVDNAFEFFRQANIQAIFSFQQLIITNKGSGLIVTNWQSLTNYDVGLAQHVWTNYQANLDDFAIGNEPEEADYRHPPFGTATNDSDLITNYASYLNDWNGIANAITNACHGATFAAVDSGSYDWGAPGAGFAPNSLGFSNFPYAQRGSGRMDMWTQHQYPCNSFNPTTPDQEVEDMLGTNLLIGNNSLADYGVVLNPNMRAVVTNGYPYRFDEGEDVGHGVTNASNAFAGAVWMLDYLHWWATNSGCQGFDFTEVIPYPESVVYYYNGHYEVFPKGEALKAWDLGGHGYAMPQLSFSNPDSVNATSYAVGNGQDLYVTLIDKNTPSTGISVTFSLTLNGFQDASVQSIYLQSATDDLYNTNDTLLGGVAITNNTQWQGMWSNMPAYTGGGYSVTLKPTEAAILHFRSSCNYSTPIQINNDGLMEIFTANPTNGHLYHLWQDNPSNAFAAWNGTWADMGVLASGSPNVTNIAGPCVIKNLDGTLEVFASGSDGNVYADSQTHPRGGWTGWSYLGGPEVTNLQAELNPDGSVNLFGIGINGDIWNNSQIAPGITNLIWNDMGTPSSGTTIQPGFVVRRNLNGCLELFGVDAEGNFWWNMQNTNRNWNTWSGWNEVSGVTLNPRVQVDRSIDGIMWAFGIDTTTGEIDYDTQNDDGTWNNWNTTSVGDPKSDVTVQPGFAVGADADGEHDIIGVGSDSNVYHNWTIPGGWNGWVSLGGTNSNPQVAVGNTLGGAVQVFVTGGGNHVWSAWQSAPDSTTWIGWANFGGSGQIFYPGQP